MIYEPRFSNVQYGQKIFKLASQLQNFNFMNRSGDRYSFKGATLLSFLNLKNLAIVVGNDKKININTKI